MLYIGFYAITFEDKSSQVIIRTPTLLRRYGVLTNYYVRSSLRKLFEDHFVSYLSFPVFSPFLYGRYKFHFLRAMNM